MNPLRILLVDPDSKNVRILRNNFADLNFEVEAAASDAEALEKINSQPFHAILTEVAAPGIDGYRLLEQTQNSSLNRRCTIIFLTQKSDVWNRVKSFKLGAKDYIIKPIHVREIVARVRMVLMRQQRLQQQLKHSRRQFNGQLAELGVTELIEVFGAERKSGILTVYGESGATGRISFREGAVVQAAAARHRGEEAVLKMLAWRKGRFSMLFTAVETADEIGVSNMGLLLQGARRMEKREELLKNLPPLESVLVTTANFRKIIAKKELASDLEYFVNLFDGVRSLGRIIDESKYDEITTLQRICKLYELGFLHALREFGSEESAAGTEPLAGLYPAQPALAAEEPLLRTPGAAAWRGDEPEEEPDPHAYFRDHETDRAEAEPPVRREAPLPEGRELQHEPEMPEGGAEGEGPGWEKIASHFGAESADSFLREELDKVRREAEAYQEPFHPATPPAFGIEPESEALEKLAPDLSAWNSEEDLFYDLRNASQEDHALFADHQGYDSDTLYSDLNDEVEQHPADALLRVEPEEETLAARKPDDNGHEKHLPGPPFAESKAHPAPAGMETADSNDEAAAELRELERNLQLEEKFRLAHGSILILGNNRELCRQLVSSLCMGQLQEKGAFQPADSELIIGTAEFKGRHYLNLIALSLEREFAPVIDYFASSLLGFIVLIDGRYVEWGYQQYLRRVLKEKTTLPVLVVFSYNEYLEAPLDEAIIRRRLGLAERDALQMVSDFSPVNSRRIIFRLFETFYRPRPARNPSAGVMQK